MKNIGFIGLLLLLAGAAQADPRDDALSAMLRCSGVADRPQRLVCYDSAVVRVPGALNTAAPPPPVAVSAVPPPAPVIASRRQRSFMDRLFGPGGPNRAPQTSVAQFGSESIASGGAKAFPIPMDGDTIDQISARLVSYELRDGRITVSLDNGQVWRQVSGDPVPHLSRPVLSYVVTVARGGAGAYDMKLSHFGQTVPVRRIQ